MSKDIVISAHPSQTGAEVLTVETRSMGKVDFIAPLVGGDSVLAGLFGLIFVGLLFSGPQIELLLGCGAIVAGLLLIVFVAHRFGESGSRVAIVVGKEAIEAGGSRYPLQGMNQVVVTSQPGIADDHLRHTPAGSAHHAAVDAAGSSVQIVYGGSRITIVAGLSKATAELVRSHIHSMLARARRNQA